MHRLLRCSPEVVTRRARSNKCHQWLVSLSRIVAFGHKVHFTSSNKHSIQPRYLLQAKQAFCDSSSLSWAVLWGRSLRLTPSREEKKGSKLDTHHIRILQVDYLALCTQVFMGLHEHWEVINTHTGMPHLQFL